MSARHYGHLAPELAVDEATNSSVDDEFDWEEWKREEAERQANNRGDR